MVRDKFRVRFRKAGDLRLVSHHDLMRCFERMLRRAELPFHSTAGFNPKPRMVFALSLPLGVVGCQEVVELELAQAMSAEELHVRLRREAPPGIDILSVRKIDSRITAQPRRAGYRFSIPHHRAADVEGRARQLLAEPECWVERSRPQPRRIDVRPFVHDLRVGAEAVELAFWVTPNGTARPDEILTLLGLHDLLDQGGVIERTLLELHDETQDGDGGPSRDCSASAAAVP